jgi:hypothetical protein
MPRAFGSHLVQFPADQFQPLIGLDHASLDHAIEITHPEQAMRKTVIARVCVRVHAREYITRRTE